MNTININGKKELDALLRKYTYNEQEIEEIKADILSKPSGEPIYFVCRQQNSSCPNPYHKQEVFRVYHN
mgnify:CR=1 FL=1